MLVRFGRTMRDALRQPDFRGIIFFLFVLLISGTVFYHLVEHWRILDSLYFSVSTLTTLGYGDLVPKTDLAKIFTMVYVMLGIGTMFSFINRVSSHARRESAVKTLTGIDPYEAISKGVNHFTKKNE